MNPTWPDLVASDINEDSCNPTGDVFLSEVQKTEHYLSTDLKPNNFSRWPIRTVDNVTSYEEVDQLNLDPPIIERSLGPTQVFLVSGLPGKPKGVSTCVVVSFPSSLHTVAQDFLQTPPPLTHFHPDFFNIRRWITYVFQTSPPQPKRQPQVQPPIPVTIAPQVVREAQERNITDDLETGIKFAQENYSTLKRVEVNIEHDPEIVDRKTIRFTLTVSGEPELVLKDEFKFKKKLYSTLGIKTCEQITTTYKWKS